jgi:nicotinamide-nucleotide amidase
MNDHDHILKALTDAESRVDLVLITGGLGPTKDDVTKKVLCAYFDCGLVINELVLEQVTSMLTRRNIRINQLNKDQALVPEKCTVLLNAVELRQACGLKEITSSSCRCQGTL